MKRFLQYMLVVMVSIGFMPMTTTLAGDGDNDQVTTTGHGDEAKDGDDAKHGDDAKEDEDSDSDDHAKDGDDAEDSDDAEKSDDAKDEDGS